MDRLISMTGFFLNTQFTFTGQREESALGGIYFFQSRWFDPSLGRFLSPDTIVPTSTQGTQAWDRYAFVNNNPVRYNDPTGHEAHEDNCDYYGECEETEDDTSSQQQQVNEVPEKIKKYVFNVLCGGDPRLYAAWEKLYGTASGRELALFISENNIRMEFWGVTGTSLSECGVKIGGCVIHIRPGLIPSSLDPDPDLSELTAELGHEGYHMKYGTPWHPGTRDLPTNSQFEEFGAYQAGDRVYYELTGSHLFSFDGYDRYDRVGLNRFFSDYAPKIGSDYLSLPSFPPFYPSYLP